MFEESMFSQIVTNQEVEKCEKLFAELYIREEENIDEVLEKIRVVTFLNLEVKRQFIDTMEGFLSYPLFKMFDDISYDLDVHLSKKDKLSLFTLKSIEKQSERISQFADWAILRSYKRTPEWSLLAGRIKLQELKLTAVKKFSELPQKIPKWFSEEAHKYISLHSEDLDNIINHERDMTFSYMSLCTLIKSYLLKKNEKEIYETPQMMFLRSAIQQYMNTEDDYQKELSSIVKVYSDLSLKKYSHASPTFFNSLSKKPGLSSCFLIKIPDNMEGILNTNTAAGLVSSVAGGLGFSQTDIRHGNIGALGKSSGVVKQCKMFNATLQYVDQNGKRPGAGAFYLEPWHIDVFDFCDLKKATGSDSQRARDNFYALWVNDLFMERVESKGTWTLFCPKDTEDSDGKTLHYVYGDEFRARYLKLEEDKNIPKKVVEAEKLWYHILSCQVETGGPFICYKDTVNSCNNQEHLGVIKQSNLCTEIVEYTDDNQAATCNLASISLKTFVQGKRFNFSLLESACRQLVRNLDRIIDVTYIHHSLDNLIRKPNFLNRPLGIGVNGFANLLQEMRLAWSDESAKQLNEDIFETMLYACINESVDLAIDKEPFDRWQESPWGRGKLPFDLYNDMMHKKDRNYTAWASTRYDWEKVRERIKKYGIRNVFFIALMPTASTAHISGSNEAFEPWTQNCYLRSLLSGEFLVVNEDMVNDLIKLGIWDERTQRHFKQNDGSIKNLEIDTSIYSWWGPKKHKEFQRLQEIYMTAFEIPMKHQIQMVSERQKFIDQAQSFNFFCDKLDYNYMTAFHFAGWRRGLKTGMYYFRGKPVTENMNQQNKLDELKAKTPQVCVLDRDSGCVSCQ